MPRSSMGPPTFYPKLSQGRPSVYNVVMLSCAAAANKSTHWYAYMPAGMLPTQRVSRKRLGIAGEQQKNKQGALKAEVLQA